MLKWLLHRLTDRFESRYQYDAAYLHEIIDVSPAASLRLSKLRSITSYSGPYPEPWAGAALAATLHGDCGPCAQLVVDMLLEAGIRAEQLQACLESDWATAADVGLGYRFARATLNGSGEVDALRERIVHRFGQHGLIAIAYATSTFEVYPRLKRALGFHQHCQSLDIVPVTVS